MTLSKRPVVFTCPGKKFGFLSREDAMRAAEDALLGPTGAGRLGESPQRWTTTVGDAADLVTGLTGHGSTTPILRRGTGL